MAQYIEWTVVLRMQFDRESEAGRCLHGDIADAAEAHDARFVAFAERDYSVESAEKPAPGQA